MGKILFFAKKINLCYCTFAKQTKDHNSHNQNRIPLLHSTNFLLSYSWALKEKKNACTSELLALTTPTPKQREEPHNIWQNIKCQSTKLNTHLPVDA